MWCGIRCDINDNVTPELRQLPDLIRRVDRRANNIYVFSLLSSKKEHLISDGLDVGFYDYYTISGSTFSKSAGCALNASINSSSLNQLIATFRRGDYQTMKSLVILFIHV